MPKERFYRPGEMIGAYEVVQLVDVGGTGVIYVGEDA